jgi:hypothetical protein
MSHYIELAPQGQLELPNLDSYTKDLHIYTRVVGLKCFRQLKGRGSSSTPVACGAKLVYLGVSCLSRASTLPFR